MVSRAGVEGVTKGAQGKETTAAMIMQSFDPSAVPLLPPTSLVATTPKASGDATSGDATSEAAKAVAAMRCHAAAAHATLARSLAVNPGSLVRVMLKKERSQCSGGRTFGGCVIKRGRGI